VTVAGKTPAVFVGGWRGSATKAIDALVAKFAK
jgi:hypothetical protein